MKIRQGFVSNSSSSSFIVEFPKNFKLTVPNLKKLMFPNNETRVEFYGDAISTDAVVEQVYKDMKGQKSNNKKRIEQELRSYDFPECLREWPQYDHKMTTEERMAAWDKEDARMKAFLESKLPELYEQWKDSKVYVFEYSDNDGNFFSTMEHGGIFDNLKHMRISHH